MMTAPGYSPVLPSRPVDGAIGDTPELTHVDLLWIGQRVENRIRFGRTEQQHVIDRHWRVVSFSAGSIFAFVRWAANAYGTKHCVSILPTSRPTTGGMFTTVCPSAPGRNLIREADITPGYGGSR
jgi:hypothetical protein